jgi:hypothetical protein
LQGEIFGSSGWWSFRTDTDNAFNLDVYNANNPKTALTVDQSGNLKVGTTWTDGRVNIGSPNTGNLISMTADNSNAYLKLGLATDYAWIQSYGPRPLHINNLGNDVLLNLNGGNVGIGTTITSARLTIDGDVKCEEVKVEIIPGSGPDYVFASDYNLLPLSELETYIKANKHLPEVPSAKQMEEEGLNLKEMNLILLKKVEELTLHLIDLKKENELIRKQLTK